MKILLFIAALILAVTTLSIAASAQETRPIAGSDNDTESNDQKDIERLEFEWNAANEVSDTGEIRRLLAEDSYHIGPSGRYYNKIQDIATQAAARERKISENRKVKFDTHDRLIRIYEGVAVVTGRGTSVTTVDGQQRVGSPFRFVHVWEKRSGRWQLVVDQVTAIRN